MIKTLNKLGIEGNFLNLIKKNTYKKHTTKIRLNGKNSKLFPYEQEKGKDVNSHLSLSTS